MCVMLVQKRKRNAQLTPRGWVDFSSHTLGEFVRDLLSYVFGLRAAAAASSCAKAPLTSSRTSPQVRFVMLLLELLCDTEIHASQSGSQGRLEMCCGVECACVGVRAGLRTQQGGMGGCGCCLGCVRVSFRPLLRKQDTYVRMFVERARHTYKYSTS